MWYYNIVINAERKETETRMREIITYHNTPPLLIRRKGAGE
jgi:hypothetical protein